MAEKAADKEKILTIPLREVYKKSERKRGAYASRYIASYIARHSKSKDVKIGQELNKTLWARGLRKPARSVKIKIVNDGGMAKAELVGFEYKEFKTAPKTEKKGAKERLMERLGPKALKKEEEEKKIEGKTEEAKKLQKEENVDEKGINKEIKEAAQ